MPQPPSDRQGDGSGADQGSGSAAPGTTDDGSSATDSSATT
jgi:hypothetical protein